MATEKRLVVFALGLIVVFMSLGFVFGIHTTSPPSQTFQASNVSKSYFLNITLNNTGLGDEQNNNFTYVNITLPSGFSFIENTNGSSAFYGTGFLNTSTLLSWTNTTRFLVNGSANNTYFWFNISIPAYIVGYYNITIASVNFTAIYRTNLSIFVNDAVFPAVTLISPVNNRWYGVSSLNFSINASDNINLSNCWVTLTNTKTNYTLFNSTLAGNSYINYLNYTNTSIADGMYNSTFYCNDTSNNLNNSIRTTFGVDTVVPIILNGSMSDINSTMLVNRSYIFFNASITETNPASINFTLFNMSWTLINSTYYSLGDVSLNNTINWGLLPNGNYTANVTVVDNAGNSNTTRVINLIQILDVTAPAVTLQEPADATSTVTTSWNFTFDVGDDSSVTSCVLIWDGVAINSLTSVSKVVTNRMTNDSLSVAAHTWNVNCTDVAGNVGNSTKRTLTIVPVPAAASSSGSGGGNPSFWTNTYGYADKEFSSYAQIVKELRVKERMSVKVSGTTHYLGITKIENNQATINVSSTPQSTTLGVGQNAKFEITGDNYYDLKVTLNGINSNKANLTIAPINELVTQTTNAAGQNRTVTPLVNSNTAGNTPPTLPPTPQKNRAVYVIVGILVFVIIIILIIFVLKNKKANHRVKVSSASKGIRVH